MAEEIVQNAFITAAHKIHQFDSGRPFLPWFIRSVVNASLKEAKRQERYASLEDPLPGQDYTLAEILADKHILPEDWLEQKENRESMQSAIDRLPADQRAVIVMRYFLDASEQEMSTEFHRPLSTIKYWLRKARKRLREYLASPDSTPPAGTAQAVPAPKETDEGVGL